MISLNSSDAAQQDQTDQINAQTRQYGNLDGKLPQSATPGSVATWQDKDKLYVTHADSSGGFKDIVAIPRTLTFYTGLTQTATAPTTTELPADGNFGWHLNTATDKLYWALNISGAIRYPSFASIEGFVSDIPGTITATQHGTLSGTGPFHAFQGITGTITDAQHGSRGSGTLHAAVTAATNGFMISGDKSKLDNYPGNCTTVAGDSNAVQRAAGVINATQYNASGVKVVSARQTGWALPSGTASRLTFDTATVTTEELAKRVFALLQDLYSTAGHGLIGA